jgi:[ribosomal protein S18]-alanine N-acetyltransferase
MPSHDQLSPSPLADPMAIDQLTIRTLSFADLPQVIGIERRAFPTPWSPAMFVLELSKSSTIALGAVVPELPRTRRLAGYLICSRYADVWHLMNVAVDPPLRRRGVAASLMEALIERAGPEEPFTLEVRPTNAAAITLYDRFGFRPAGTRPRYYQDTGEDALIMWRRAPSGLDSEASP